MENLLKIITTKLLINKMSKQTDSVDIERARIVEIIRQKHQKKQEDLKQAIADKLKIKRRFPTNYQKAVLLICRHSDTLQIRIHVRVRLRTHA
jgi:hypothetical protein